MELLSFVDLDGAVTPSEAAAISVTLLLISAWYSGANEFDATKRVYNQPIFRQNLTRRL